MAKSRKKQMIEEPQEIAEVKLQPITETIEKKLYAVCHDEHNITRYPRNRRLQALAQEAALYHV